MFLRDRPAGPIGRLACVTAIAVFGAIGDASTAPNTRQEDLANGQKLSWEDPAEARRAFLAAMAKAERIGAGDEQRLEILKRLALVAKDRIEEEGYRLRVLALSEILYGKVHQETADALNSLAGLYSEYEETYDAAEPLLRRALGIREVACGEFSREVAEDSQYLAFHLKSKGAFTESERLYRRTLEIDERILEEGDHETIMARSLLASFLMHQGRPLEAEPLWRRNLDLLETKEAEMKRHDEVPDYYTRHAEVVQQQRSLADSLQAQGALQEAEILGRAVVSFYRETAIDTENLASSERQLAGILARRGELSQAEELLSAQIADLVRTGDIETTDYAALLEEMAPLLESTCRKAIAQEMRQSARVIRRRLIEKFEVSLPKYQRIGPCATYVVFELWIENLEALEGPNAPALPQVLDRYADFNRRLGHIGRARELAARAQQIRASPRVSSTS